MAERLMMATSSIPVAHGTFGTLKNSSVKSRKMNEATTIQKSIFFSNFGTGKLNCLILANSPPIPAIGQIPHHILPRRNAEMGRTGNHIHQVMSIPGLVVR